MRLKTGGVVHTQGAPLVQMLPWSRERRVRRARVQPQAPPKRGPRAAGVPRQRGLGRQRRPSHVLLNQLPELLGLCPGH